MHSTITPQITIQHTNLRNQHTRPRIPPPTIIHDLHKNLLSTILRCHNQNRNHSDQKSAQMSKKRDGFEHRKGFGAPGVEADCYDEETEHDERVLPVGEYE